MRSYSRWLLVGPLVLALGGCPKGRPQQVSEAPPVPTPTTEKATKKSPSKKVPTPPPRVTATRTKASSLPMPASPTPTVEQEVPAPPPARHVTLAIAPRVKIYRADSLLYPFVQVYFRTQDQDRNPLDNLNERNVGIMVQGRSYDPLKRQYVLQTVINRDDALRTVIVLSAHQSMAAAFKSVQEAVTGYIDGMRPQDETAILAMRDTQRGYETVSDFTSDKSALGRRLGGIVADGATARLYDTVGAAMQLCASGSAVKGPVGGAQAKYIASCSIVVVSDGYDVGDAITRDQLMTRISTLAIPLPIFSVACPTTRANFANLQGLSENSFGKYYPIDGRYRELQKAFDNVRYIVQNDYVLTFRSYLPVDGNEHPIKLVIERPTGSGNIIYDGAKFEANEAPPIKAVQEQVSKLGASIKLLSDKNPYAGSAPEGEQPPGKKSIWPF